MIQNLFVSIVQTPALLVGLLAVLGLILQHKKTTQVIQGGIKTFAGFLILTGGAGILVNSLDPFAKMFQFSVYRALYRAMKQLLPLPWLTTAL